jgi:hypothetical protein
MRFCLSRRNQPDHLAVGRIAVGVRHEQHYAGCHPDCLPSHLSFNYTILSAKRTRIVENQLGYLETHLVL